MDNLYWLHELLPSDLGTVGDRAFLLGNLTRQRHPVLPGFVISAASFWQFLRSIDWSDPLFVDLPESFLYFDINNSRQLQIIAQRIRSQILNTPLPPDWISALGDAVGAFQTAACLLSPELIVPHLKTAGILETASCRSDAESVASGVKRAWAEVFRARSLLYWRTKGVSLPQLKPTLLVQPLPDAIASGSACRSGRGTLLVRANWGLTLDRTAGEAEPERHQIDVETGDIQGQTRGRQSIVYRLKSGPDEDTGDGLPPVPGHPPIGGKIIEEERQKQWILTESRRSAWIPPMGLAIAEIGSSCGIDWVVAGTADASEPQWLISGVRSAGEMGDVSNTFPPPSAADGAAAPDRGGSLWGLGAAKGRAVASAYVIADTNADLATFESGSILVVPSLTPRWLPLLKRASGLIAEQGGMTGHGAIVARELGIPAVLGVLEATRRTKTGQVLLLDGDRGEVRPVAPEKSETGDVSAADPNAGNPGIVPVQFPTATRLMANVSQSESIDRLPGLPIDGVGLVRSELLALDLLSGGADTFDTDGLPNFQHWLEPEGQDRFVRGMKAPLGKLASILAPKPIFYRALDLREFYHRVRPSRNAEVPEFVRLQSSSLCNWHRSPENRTLFDLELAVLSDLQEAGAGNINLILPFVRSVGEFSTYRTCVERAGLTRNPQFQLWMMAEVPSVIFQLADYEKAGARGIAIGTNDLTQLMLGIDRDRTRRDGELNARHPALLEALRQLIQTAHTLGLGTSICGDAPTLYPDLIDALIEWGIESISVSLDAVAPTHLAIARAEQRLILAASRKGKGVGSRESGVGEEELKRGRI
ncbi:putative PEP-binding protein [Lyngbya sp. CCY1209]|uniref:putative PEP-binding protein n=1 Tax=Lyngbya sp. CCY1209 TaxID=2886103 RepID=UPI002D20C9AE|nr:putative PEP-binding protein [Lyngbya sp. CCY1209]MEB3886167.1 phosphoenolpyruvate synthase [Lyngbya sp. CCY1209]